MTNRISVLRYRFQRVPLVVATLLGIVSSPAEATIRTRVFLNGKATPVHFNDGDSFRILDGRLTGSRTRIAGFNTLESYGPVHQWGDWTRQELYFLAKTATQFARRGTWSCTWAGEHDTYGRLLVRCPGLAAQLIQRGLAFALSITDEPAPARLLQAQRHAITHRLGIWAHGVPEYLLMSAHSKASSPERPFSYNRLVSTRDGHSEMWRHTDHYATCELLCSKAVRVDKAVLERSRHALRETAQIDTVAVPGQNEQLNHLLRIYVATNSVAAFVPERDRPALRMALAKLVEDEILVSAAEWPDSCFVFVPGNRRYRAARASCLK